LQTRKLGSIHQSLTVGMRGQNFYEFFSFLIKALAAFPKKD